MSINNVLDKDKQDLKKDVVGDVALDKGVGGAQLVILFISI